MECPALSSLITLLIQYETAAVICYPELLQTSAYRYSYYVIQFDLGTLEV